MIGWKCKQRELFSLPVLIVRGLDHLLLYKNHILFARLSIFYPKCCAVAKFRLKIHVFMNFQSIDFPGDYSGEVTPVTIPNTEVKGSSADGTSRVTSWESRTLPGIFHINFACYFLIAGFFIA